jgi:transcriptional regulator with XRE-family HTH domain
MRQGRIVDSDDQQVGAIVREARLGARLTQHELARRLGWSPDTLANYETGRRGLRAAQLLKVAAALGVPPAALLLAAPQAAEVLRRLGDDAERWAQVRLFLDALDEGRLEGDHGPPSP